MLARTHHIFRCFLGLRGALHRRKVKRERGSCHLRFAYTVEVPLRLIVLFHEPTAHAEGGQIERR